MFNPFVGGGYALPPTARAGGQTATGARMDNGVTVVIDGTPIRVVTIAVAMALGIYAFRTAGIKFNVGVSA